jgi:hypothetical protein
LLYGQSIPSQDQKSLLIKACSTATGTSPENPFHIGFQNFTIIGKDTFFNFNGYSNLFKIKGNHIVRLDHSKFHGFNFNRYLFSFKNDIYQIGGYGFFRTNNELLVFSKYGWEVCPSFGTKPQFIEGIIARIGNKMIFSHNSKSGNGVYKDTYDKNVYVLNLNSKKWRLSGYVSNPFFNGYKRTITTEDFEVYENGKTIGLIKKGTVYARIIPQNQWSSGGRLSYLHAEKDNYIRALRFQNELLVDTLKINVDAYYSNEKFSKMPLYLLDEVSIFPVAFLFISIVVVILFLLKLYFRNVPSKNKLKPEMLEIINRLEKYKGKQINVDELDEILEISHLIQDSKKLRRHRLLNDLDNIYPGYISRIKDESDKRKFLYQIKK